MTGFNGLRVALQCNPEALRLAPVDPESALTLLGDAGELLVRDMGKESGKPTRLTQHHLMFGPVPTVGPSSTELRGS